MSQPFSNQPNAPFPGGPTAPGGYAQTPFAPPPQKSRWWLWILGGCGCSTVLLLICCGGFTYWGASQGGRLLGNAMQEALQTEIADNADVEEHLGEISSLTVNFAESGKEKQARGGADNWLVMDAEGTKGNGTFIVATPTMPQEGVKFTKIELKLPDGKIIPIK